MKIKAVKSSKRIRLERTERALRALAMEIKGQAGLKAALVTEARERALWKPLDAGDDK